jgi:acylphosphatase
VEEKPDKTNPDKIGAMAAAVERSALRFVIHGRVQGVGYRSFAERAASLTGVSGWVRNRDDGTVEAVGYGTKEQLDAFAGHLRTGPRWSEVRAVDVAECAPPGNRGFAVRY